mmetsp:Transcript_111211/g.192818  ORF Transcript_111211/g.192818 Transcript_111211/m.192818 type:complete len:105 (-) Transcript_111211:65-379(-)
MITVNCGGLPSQHDSRAKALTGVCKDVDADELKVWKMFSKDEVNFFRDSYPAKLLDGEEEKGGVSYKQALQTLKEVDGKELYCLTLFTIDDECVKYNHVRFAAE